jgi:hypothetical protein
MWQKNQPGRFILLPVTNHQPGEPNEQRETG